MQTPIVKQRGKAAIDNVDSSQFILAGSENEGSRAIFELVILQFAFRTCQSMNVSHYLAFYANMRNDIASTIFLQKPISQ